MATSNTGSTSLVFRIAHRHLPAAEAWHRVPDQMILLRGVYLMAGAARASATGDHQMDIVEIAVAIAEGGIGGSNGFRCQRAAMTLKTKRILFLGERLVNLSRVGLAQQLVMHGTMDGMT